MSPGCAVQDPASSAAGCWSSQVSLSAVVHLLACLNVAEGIETLLVQSIKMSLAFGAVNFAVRDLSAV